MNKKTLKLLQEIRADYENLRMDILEQPLLCDWDSIAKKRIDEINALIEDALK